MSNNIGRKGYAVIKVGKQNVSVFFSTLALSKLEELTGKTVASIAVEGGRITEIISRYAEGDPMRAIASASTFSSSYLCSLEFLLKALFAGNMGDRKDKALSIPEIAGMIDDAADEREDGVLGVIFEIASQILLPLLRAQAMPTPKGEEKKPESNAVAIP